eukprot:PhF_6_TR21159/c0_g1_i2/m.30469
MGCAQSNPRLRVASVIAPEVQQNHHKQQPQKDNPLASSHEVIMVTTSAQSSPNHDHHDDDGIIKSVCAAETHNRSTKEKDHVLQNAPPLFVSLFQAPPVESNHDSKRHERQCSMMRMYQPLVSPRRLLGTNKKPVSPAEKMEER